MFRVDSFYWSCCRTGRQCQKNQSWRPSRDSGSKGRCQREARGRGSRAARPASPRRPCNAVERDSKPCLAATACRAAKSSADASTARRATPRQSGVGGGLEGTRAYGAWAAGARGPGRLSLRAKCGRARMQQSLCRTAGNRCRRKTNRAPKMTHARYA